MIDDLIGGAVDTAVGASESTSRRGCLTGLLLNEAAEPEVGLVNTPIQNLQVLPSGPLPPNPSELLASPAMEHMIEALRARADYVIFYSPPILAVTDASILAANTDGAILVAEQQPEGQHRATGDEREHDDAGEQPAEQQRATAGGHRGRASRRRRCRHRSMSHFRSRCRFMVYVTLPPAAADSTGRSGASTCPIRSGGVP